MPARLDIVQAVRKSRQRGAAAGELEDFEMIRERLFGGWVYASELLRKKRKRSFCADSEDTCLTPAHLLDCNHDAPAGFAVSS